jgi:hypothetical protein
MDMKTEHIKNFENTKFQNEPNRLQLQNSSEANNATVAGIYEYNLNADKQTHYLHTYITSSYDSNNKITYGFKGLFIL